MMTDDYKADDPQTQQKLLLHFFNDRRNIQSTKDALKIYTKHDIIFGKNFNIPIAKSLLEMYSDSKFKGLCKNVLLHAFGQNKGVISEMSSLKHLLIPFICDNFVFISKVYDIKFLLDFFKDNEIVCGRKDYKQNFQSSEDLFYRLLYVCVKNVSNWKVLTQIFAANVYSDDLENNGDNSTDSLTAILKSNSASDFQNNLEQSMLNENKNIEQNTDKKEIILNKKSNNNDSSTKGTMDVSKNLSKINEMIINIFKIVINYINQKNIENTYIPKIYAEILKYNRRNLLSPSGNIPFKPFHIPNLTEYLVETLTSEDPIDISEIIDACDYNFLPKYVNFVNEVIKNYSETQNFNHYKVLLKIQRIVGLPYLYTKIKSFNLDVSKFLSVFRKSRNCDLSVFLDVFDEETAEFSFAIFPAIASYCTDKNGSIKTVTKIIENEVFKFILNTKEAAKLNKIKSKSEKKINFEKNDTKNKNIISIKEISSIVYGLNEIIYSIKKNLETKLILKNNITAEESVSMLRVLKESNLYTQLIELLFFPEVQKNSCRVEVIKFIKYIADNTKNNILYFNIPQFTLIFKAINLEKFTSETLIQLDKNIYSPQTIFNTFCNLNCVEHLKNISPHLDDLIIKHCKTATDIMILFDILVPYFNVDFEILSKLLAYCNSHNKNLRKMSYYSFTNIIENKKCLPCVCESFMSSEFTKLPTIKNRLVLLLSCLEKCSGCISSQVNGNTIDFDVFYDPKTTSGALLNSINDHLLNIKAYKEVGKCKISLLNTLISESILCYNQTSAKTREKIKEILSNLITKKYTPYILKNIMHGLNSNNISVVNSSIEYFAAFVVQTKDILKNFYLNIFKELVDTKIKHKECYKSIFVFYKTVFSVIEHRSDVYHALEIVDKICLSGTNKLKCLIKGWIKDLQDDFKSILPPNLRKLMKLKFKKSGKEISMTVTKKGKIELKELYKNVNSDHDIDSD
ncbi:hypothetical protein EDEG_00833 [Edhazardia aedis USNM 41457]|uniref:Uncharacterized protein n=1 Tax=Edhazardia aedis (strain USNM 41457) TaxID=1003232 RepID=J9DUW3_EDHAE|nr:hypothetical protein EDEG_00833 [Edhazardia aedis USNM 41457]|eukprot:EJW05052.1 hypothetical protein EDEG_00833 [Edhazardia aedis USNM 41457]